MNHLKTFEQLTQEGFKDTLKKGVIVGSMAASILGSPSKSYGQSRFKDFIKKEIGSKSNLPQIGQSEFKELDGDGLIKLVRDLDKNGYEKSPGSLGIERFPSGEYIITSSKSKTKSAGELQNQQSIKSNIDDRKLIRSCSYVKEEGNWVEVITVALIK